jgi:trehalose synthase-fused probable maltokinase
MSSSTVATVRVSSLSEPLNETAIANLEALLPAYLNNRRWYRTKTKNIRQVKVQDVFSLPNSANYVLILAVELSDGEIDNYILPLALATNESAEEEVIANLSSADGDSRLQSALGNAEFRQSLLAAIAREQTVKGKQGALVAARTSAWRDPSEAELESLPSVVSRAEQSNTSVIYGQQFILKLFRKLENGINPDIEIGAFLTRRGFKNTPAVLGSLEYRVENDPSPYGAGILQQFVPNHGDAWKFTLDSLQAFFERALPSKRLAPTLSSEHPLMLIGQEVPPKLRLFVGDYMDAAALLGRRTAEMHLALADPEGGPDFAPQSLALADNEHLAKEFIDQAETTFALLENKRSSFEGVTLENVDKALGLRSQILARFSAIANQPISAQRIRFHGDYHLGQVLYTGSDFMIIDFEGEPARPLAERRAKALALRDVAGMIRSFQYAAFAALFGQIPGLPSDPASLSVIEGWAAAWNATVSSAYLRAYFERAGDASFIPATWPERRMLLDAFVLQKALYEIAYELNNRPLWLPIPVRGILSLIN